MPRVYLPPGLRTLAGGEAFCDVEATTVREALAAVERLHPGVYDRLCDGGELRPEVVVAVDGRVSGLGLLQKLPPNSEVHFLPAVGGG
jgi:molybdopterin synthase sulfur carrier subunit